MEFIIDILAWSNKIRNFFRSWPIRISLDEWIVHKPMIIRKTPYGSPSSYPTLNPTSLARKQDILRIDTNQPLRIVRIGKIVIFLCYTVYVHLFTTQSYLWLKDGYPALMDVRPSCWHTGDANCWHKSKREGPVPETELCQYWSGIDFITFCLSDSFSLSFILILPLSLSFHTLPGPTD